MFGLFGDISVLSFSQDWQIELILLYLMDAENSTIVKSWPLLKSIIIILPELEMDFIILWLGVPNSSPISMDWSLGPSYTRISFSRISIYNNFDELLFTQMNNFSRAKIFLTLNVWNSSVT